ncbi:MAG TPA: phosphoribosylanthranilate isomerase [Steroidobacteraceae bacterium]|nr:phosphoribosylanthranilate isomerase [Steroidobacteraceae bacterium]
MTPAKPQLWIKICGLSDAAAVDAALQAGVDGIGFVFSPSPRQVQAAQAARLALPARGKALCIAVTRHPKQELLDEILREFKPDGWQTDINDLSVLRVPRQLPILPVLRSGSPALESPPRRFLFEGPSSGQGVTTDWSEAARLAGHSQLILAGGLRVDNVAAAIATVRPFGIDVSSGVEVTPGCKSPALIAAFVAAARDAHARVSATHTMEIQQ